MKEGFFWAIEALETRLEVLSVDEMWKLLAFNLSSIMCGTPQLRGGIKYDPTRRGILALLNDILSIRWESVTVVLFDAHPPTLPLISLALTPQTSTDIPAILGLIQQARPGQIAITNKTWHFHLLLARPWWTCVILCQYIARRTGDREFHRPRPRHRE